MKKLIVLVGMIISTIALNASSVQVRLEQQSRPDEFIASQIEANVSYLLTELNNATNEHRPVDLKSLNLDDDVVSSINMLLDNYILFCPETIINENCLQVKNGYQLRNIPIYAISKATDAPGEREHNEAVINFTSQGKIDAFYFAIDKNLYKKVVQSSIEVKDERRRQIILDYVERFRTAYNQRDSVFLQNIFSEDALIIAGKVVKRSQDGIPLPPKIEYTVRSKKDYLTQLNRIFRDVSYIKVSFDNIKVVRHATMVDFYGVTLFQSYATNTYSDQGYVFLLWDFTDEDAPLIHVRTWQPNMFDGKPLPINKIVKLSDFILD